MVLFDTFTWLLYNLFASLYKYVCTWSDSIPTEAYKKLRYCLTKKLLTDEGTRYNNATIIHMYKRKGNRQLCDNNRGISLLSIADKILAIVLLNRITTHLKQGLMQEGQCGFRKARCTIDMVIAAGLLQEEMRRIKYRHPRHKRRPNEGIRHRN